MRRWINRIGLLGLVVTVAVVGIQLFQFWRSMRAIEIRGEFLSKRMPVLRELTVVMTEFNNISRVAKENEDTANDEAIAAQLSELSRRYAAQIEELAALEVPSGALQEDELRERHLTVIEIYRICHQYQEHMADYFTLGRPPETLEMADAAEMECSQRLDELAQQASS